ncbi:MFS transporter, partial [Streptomyces sp. SID8455]|nr:MFS transporter [Streptomyces sp. SID8455]
VTMFGTASRHEFTDQLPRFQEQATPAQRLQFERTGELPPPWGNEVLTAGVSSAFVVAACFAVFAALVALLVIQVRASDLARLQGGATPGVTVPG